MVDGRINSVKKYAKRILNFVAESLKRNDIVDTVSSITILWRVN